MATINREILKWARKTAKITLEKSASTISKTCKVDRIKEWESEEGKEFPSIKQVEKLARLYRRPVDIFYLKFIPKDFPALKDFRINNDEGANTSLLFMMREIQEKQEWLSKFLASKKEKKLDFVGKYNVKSNPQVVASDIRKTLGITTNLNADIKPIKHWIDRAENKRIFVSLSSNYHTRLKLDSDLFKGFVISDKYAPFIFLNADDWEHGQLFTLVHELAHIWINVSGISNETAPGAHPQGTHLVEKFCREVAELALLPEEEIKPLLQVKGELTLRNISRASKRLGVSNENLLYRIGKLGLIQPDKVNTLKKEASQVWKDFLQKEAQKPKSKGGPNYYVMQLRRSSKGFSNIVMDVYKSGRVNGSDASRLLNVKEVNFVKFEKYIYKYE